MGSRESRVECLHRPAPHGRDAQGALLAVSLWNIATSKWLRVIPSVLKSGYRLRFLLWSVPDYLVHSWGCSTIVFCHSPYGKSFAAVRVGQQARPRFHLAPLAFLRCLHDTRLEPMHVVVNGLPVNVMPSLHNVVGSRTSWVNCHLLCLLHRFALLTRREETGWKSARFRVG